MRASGPEYPWSERESYLSKPRSGRPWGLSSSEAWRKAGQACRNIHNGECSARRRSTLERAHRVRFGYHFFTHGSYSSCSGPMTDS